MNENTLMREEINGTLEAGDRRDPWRAMRRGVVGRCPNCDRGHIFNAYLKVRDRCEVCGEDLHHHRADDAPPYVTILIVAHVIGAAMVTVLSLWDMPLAMQFLLWPGLVLVMSLLLLPRVKGALIALQWALRMHGFAGEADGLSPETGVATAPTSP